MTKANEILTEMDQKTEKKLLKQNKFLPITSKMTEANKILIKTHLKFWKNDLSRINSYKIRQKWLKQKMKIH